MQVVGESHYQDALIAICGRHTRVGHEANYEASIEPEPANPHDPNAVLVSIRGWKVGYLSRDQAERVSRQLQEAGLSSAVCSARVRGGWRTNQYDEGHYGVCLAIPNQGWIDFGTGMTPPQPALAEGPTRTIRPDPAPTGPLKGQRIALIGAPLDGEVATELAAAGGRIMSDVGKTTTLVVVLAERPFDTSVRRSGSFQRAEELIATGCKIEIVSISEARSIAGRVD